MVQLIVLARDRNAGARAVRLGGDDVARRGGDGGQGHPVLRPLGSRERRLDRRQVEFQLFAERGVRGARLAPQALGAGVGLDQRDLVRRAPGEAQIAQGLPVDREEAAGGAVFRGHVGDGRAVGEGERLQARAAELDELADHPVAAQHLGHGEHQVGRRGALLEGAGHPEADHLGDQHGDRLAQHGRFRLDAADAPAEDRKPVDHGGVAVGPDQRVGIGEGAAPVLAPAPHHVRQVFQIDLMADAGARRHDAEVVEGILPPAQEGVALAVAGKLHLDVLSERAGVAEGVHHDRMVDDEIDRRQRVDAFRVAAQLGHGLAHGRQVDHGGHAGEVLHQDPRRPERDLALRSPLGGPLRQGRDVAGAHADAVFAAQQVFQQDLERERQLPDAVEARRGEGGQAVIAVLPVADREVSENAVTVRGLRHANPQILMPAPWPHPGRPDIGDI